MSERGGTHVSTITNVNGLGVVPFQDRLLQGLPVQFAESGAMETFDDRLWHAMKPLYLLEVAIARRQGEPLNPNPEQLTTGGLSGDINEDTLRDVLGLPEKRNQALGRFSLEIIESRELPKGVFTQLFREEIAFPAVNDSRIALLFSAQCGRISTRCALGMRVRLNGDAYDSQPYVAGKVSPLTAVPNKRVRTVRKVADGHPINTAA
jgi:hypothetical protein